MKRLYVHGDVIIKEIGSIPEKSSKLPYTKGYSVLAYGEISGHAHCLVADKTELFELNGERFLRCLEDVEIKHQKLDGSQAKDAHDTKVLPKGNYRIEISREFDYFTGEARKVAD